MQRAQNQSTIWLTFLISATSCCLAAQLSHTFLPETAGRMLEDISTNPGAWWAPASARGAATPDNGTRHAEHSNDLEHPADEMALFDITAGATPTALSDACDASTATLLPIRSSVASEPILPYAIVPHAHCASSTQQAAHLSEPLLVPMGGVTYLRSGRSRKSRLARLYYEGLCNSRPSCLLDTLCAAVCQPSVAKDVQLPPSQQGKSQSVLALLCALDMWGAVLMLFIAVIVIVRLPARWNAGKELGTDQGTFGILLFGVFLAFFTIVRLGLLVGFFTREWSLVLCTLPWNSARVAPLPQIARLLGAQACARAFVCACVAVLFKILEGGVVLLTSTTYVVSTLLQAPLTTDGALQGLLIGVFSSYAVLLCWQMCARPLAPSQQLCRISLSLEYHGSAVGILQSVLPLGILRFACVAPSCPIFTLPRYFRSRSRELWRLPRIKEHYRRLPTRKELAEDDPGEQQHVTVM